MKPMIKPTGIGDLKVVKQKLARYEAGEIAHIENIMARESRSRKHRRLQQLEEIVELEQERTEESVRDLQSTERFEMESESKQTIRSETSFQAGVDISGGFGPVRITSSAKFATSTSKEESNSNSTKYAKDVTEKTLSRLVEKVRQLRRTRTLEESEETNEHGFNNTEGTENISGIYRWVDKYYRAKVIDYGKRLMYGFFVPEPAAFYIFATQYNLDTHVLPTKPSAPTRPDNSGLPLSPSDIQRDNYLTLVQQYNAEGVQPPPPEWIITAKSIQHEVANDVRAWSLSSDEFKIPKGYVALQAAYNSQSSHMKSHKDTWAGTILIGSESFDVSNPYSPYFFLQGESENIAVSVVGLDLTEFVLQIEMLACLTPEYFEK